MLKRMWAIAISVVMLVTLCPNVSVFAADTKPECVVENFDGKTLATINSRLVDINSAATKSIATGEGRNGGDALKITGSTSSEAIGFVGSYAYGSNVLLLAYDFKLAKAPTTNESTARAMGIAGSDKNGTSTIQLRKTSGPTFSFYDPQAGADLATVNVGKWYRIITAKYYNQTDSWVLDEDGNVVAFSNRSDSNALKTQGEFALFRSTAKGLMTDGEILIDNVEYNIYAYTFGPSLMSDTLAETDVPLSTNSVTVTFDQPLTTLSATLTPDGDSAVACTMQAKKDANGADIPMTYVVTLPALASNTKYTLDFTGSYTKQGTNSRTIYVDNTGVITFTTETVAAPKIVSHNLAETGVLKNVGSITVTFDGALAQTGATLTPAGGSAEACTMTTAGSMEDTYVVTLPALKGDTAYTLSFAACKNAAGVPVADTISFTTEAASIDETVISDDFEDASLFTGTHYDKDNTKHAFMNSGGKVASLTEQKAGYTGYGVEVKTNANAVNNTAFYSGDSFKLGEGTSYVVNYKMKITTPDPTGEKGNYAGGANIAIGTSSNPASSPSVVAIIDLDKFNGKHYIGMGYSSSAASEEGKQGYYFEEEDGKGAWYNATLAVTDDDVTFVLTDISTGEELFRNSVAKDLTNAEKQHLILAFLRKAEESKGNENIGSAITIDDVELWTVDTSKATHALTADASANANTVILTFNQPTMITHNPSDDDETNDMLVVKDNEKNEVIPYSEYDIDIKYTDFDTNVVTISGLDYGESYYLDYSAVKSAGGSAIASGEQVTPLIQFTMPKPTTSVMENAEYADGSVSLNYWAMGSESTGRFIAAFYKGTTLVKVAVIPEDKALSPDKNTVTFIPEGVPTDADGMIVYALSSLRTLVPLCVPTGKVAIN